MVYLSDWWKKKTHTSLIYSDDKTVGKWVLSYIVGEIINGLSRII